MKSRSAEDKLTEFLARSQKVVTGPDGAVSTCVEIADLMSFYGHWMARFDVKVCPHPPTTCFAYDG